MSVAPIHSSRFRLTLGSAVALFMTGAIGAAPGALLPQWQQEFGIKGEMAWYFNLFFVGAVLGIFGSGRMKVRHPWLSLALAAEGVGLWVVAVSPQFAGVLVAASLLGLGVAVANFNANAVAGQLYPESRMVVLSRINAAFGVGAVLSPLLMVLLPWRMGYGLLAVGAFAAAALLWQAPALEAQPPQSAPPRKRLIGLVLAAVVAYVGVEVVLASFSGVYLQGLGYSAFGVGLMLSLYWVGLTLSRLVLASFLAQKTVQRLSILQWAAAGVVLVYFVPPLIWLFPLVGFLIGPTFPVLYNFAHQRIGYHSLTYVFYMGLLGSSLLPAAFVWVPKAYMPLGFVVFALSMALATWYLGRQDAKSPAV